MYYNINYLNLIETNILNMKKLNKQSEFCFSSTNGICGTKAEISSPTHDYNKLINKLKVE